MSAKMNHHDMSEAIERRASPARTQLRAASNLANGIHPDSGRVHAVVRRRFYDQPKSPQSPVLLVQLMIEAI